MIRQATVQDLRNNRVTKIHGHVVVVTRFFPRYLKRQLLHEYRPELAPSRALLTAFKDAEAACGDHDRGFENVDYESQFNLTTQGHAALVHLTEIAKTKPVFLVCHCDLGQRCHRELLLLIAQNQYGAEIGRLYKDYATFRARLPLSPVD